MTGIYHPDSVRDVADSLGLQNISESVISLLASDVEYRLHQVIEEAARFTRHGKRTILTTADVDQAFKVLNIEPVYGHSMSDAPSFKRIIPTLGNPIYTLNDEEIDFERVIKEEEIPVPRAVSYAAHWLAVEGVQPLIPENPPPSNIPASTSQTKPSTQSQANGPKSPTASTNNAAAKPHLSTKSHLSRELQQYYARLTDSLSTSALDPSDRQNDRKRSAALASLRNDAGLQGILPYLVRWIGDCVVNALTVKPATGGAELDDAMLNEDDVDRATLDMILEVINAILDNQRLFVEPYLHTILPPLLSVLMTSTLSTSSSYSSVPSHPPPTPRVLRAHAASLLGHLLRMHSPTYPFISTKVTKTLILALLSDRPLSQAANTSGADGPSRAQTPASLGSKEGAIRGLVAVGKEAIYRGMIEGQACKTLSEEIERRIRTRQGGAEDDDPMVGLGDISDAELMNEQTWTEEVRDVVDAYMLALSTIHPRLARTRKDKILGWDVTGEDTQEATKTRLSEILGGFIANFIVQQDAKWAVGLADALQSRDGVPGKVDASIESKALKKAMSLDAPHPTESAAELPNAGGLTNALSDAMESS